MKTVTALLLLSLLPGPCSALGIGDTAPDFSLSGLRTEDGSAQVQLSDYRGKVVYLDFWASWCAPCKVSLPLLNTLQQRYQEQGKDFAVVAINVDSDPEAGIEFLLDNPVSYKVLQDSAGMVPKRFEIVGMPTAFLLDAEGRIHMIHEGFKRSDIDKIEQEINTLLETLP